jgi:Protein of unknown function (DUF3558)
MAAWGPFLPKGETITMTVKTHFGSVVFFLIASLILNACSSSSSAPPSNSAESAKSAPASAPSANLDVCALVTAEEMSKIGGETVTSQPKTLQTGIPACSYKATSGNPIPNGVVAIHRPNGKSTYLTAQALYKKSPGYKEVSGLGEEAFDSNDGAFYALKGDACLDVVLAQNPDVRFNQLKQIATLAIGRMP